MTNIDTDINLYKDLVKFCNDHGAEIETKFTKKFEFNDFHAECYEKMFYNNRHAIAPPAVTELKEIIPELKDAYIKAGKYLNPRNKYIKGLDIQYGQWYEKALIMFLSTKGFSVKKTKPPVPDLEISDSNGDILAYVELKYIEAPFLYACRMIKNTYPYESKRYDYEASLTLDTGQKMLNQRKNMEELEQKGYPVHFLWWFDSFHIKGLFAMTSRKVFDFYDHVGNLFERKTREGDLEAHQETEKIYPPLLEMMTFSEYLDFLNDLKH